MQNLYPKISVIIGVLNMKSHLPAAIDSVINQNYPHTELIIMDGGSTDGTGDIIKSYAEHIDFWVSEKDAGHCDACNRAIPKATGDFIVFLNADDTFDKNLFHSVAKAWENDQQAKMITVGVRIHKDDQTIIKKINDTNDLDLTLENLLFKLPVINARFFHADIFKEFGLFIPAHEDGIYNLSNDREYLIKLALNNVKTLFATDVHYNYLSHDASFTFSKKFVTRTHEEHIKLAKIFLKYPNLTTCQRQIFKSWHAKEMAYLFIHYAINKDFKNLLRIFQLGLIKQPLLMTYYFFHITINKTLKEFKKFKPSLNT